MSAAADAASHEISADASQESKKPVVKYLAVPKLDSCLSAAVHTGQSSVIDNARPLRYTTFPPSFGAHRKRLFATSESSHEFRAAVSSYFTRHSITYVASGTTHMGDPVSEALSRELAELNAAVDKNPHARSISLTLLVIPSKTSSYSFVFTPEYTSSAALTSSRLVYTVLDALVATCGPKKGSPSALNQIYTSAFVAHDAMSYVEHEREAGFNVPDIVSQNQDTLLFRVKYVKDGKLKDMTCKVPSCQTAREQADVLQSFFSKLSCYDVVLPSSVFRTTAHVVQDAFQKLELVLSLELQKTLMPDFQERLDKDIQSIKQLEHTYSFGRLSPFATDKPRSEAMMSPLSFPAVFMCPEEHRLEFLNYLLFISNNDNVHLHQHIDLLKQLQAYLLFARCLPVDVDTGFHAKNIQLYATERMLAPAYDPFFSQFFVVPINLCDASVPTMISRHHTLINTALRDVDPSIGKTPPLKIHGGLQSAIVDTHVMQRAAFVGIHAPSSNDVSLGDAYNYVFTTYPDSGIRHFLFQAMIHFGPTVKLDDAFHRASHCILNTSDAIQTADGRKRSIQRDRLLKQLLKDSNSETPVPKRLKSNVSTTFHPSFQQVQCMLSALFETRGDRQWFLEEVIVHFKMSLRESRDQYDERLRASLNKLVTLCTYTVGMYVEVDNMDTTVLASIHNVFTTGIERGIEGIAHAFTCALQTLLRCDVHDHHSESETTEHLPPLDLALVFQHDESAIVYKIDVKNKIVCDKMDASALFSACTNADTSPMVVLVKSGDHGFACQFL